MSLNNVDVLLDVLGNDTRRRILQLLADEPRYFIQLSRELGVSQQAVLKHLEILEKNGFITSYEEESDFPAPKRKYFQLSLSCVLEVGITRDAVQFVFQDIPRLDREDQIEEKELKVLSRKVNTVLEEEDPIELLQQSDDLLKEINGTLKETLETEILLLRFKQRLTRAAHKAIRESFDEELHRHILYSTIGEQKQPNIDQLSTMLDIREKEIGEALKLLKKRMPHSKNFASPPAES
ncbi:MAG: ArsR family transcriptional regulator [archaeon]|nr:ArsR family transcriptional regulator [archaeon]